VRCLRPNFEELLNDLRALLASKGRLSLTVIKDSPDLMAPGTYSKRFGSLRNAYRLIGYGHSDRLGGADTRRRNMALREELISRIVAMFPNDVSILRPGVHWRSRLLLFNRLTVSVLIVRSQLVYKTTRRWIVEPARHERKFITLLARLDESNRALVDLHVVPNIDRPKKFQISDSWLARGERLIDLSRLCEVVERVRRARKT
jgi:hypothetical protein